MDNNEFTQPYQGPNPVPPTEPTPVPPTEPTPVPPTEPMATNEPQPMAQPYEAAPDSTAPLTPTDNPEANQSLQPDILLQPEQPAKKLNKKLLIIIIVVALLPLLGIGLLVYIMIGKAHPAMETAQMDVARRRDYSELSSNVTVSIANNNGRLPTSDTLNAKKYIGSDGKDVSGADYVIKNVLCDSNDNCSVPTTLQPGEVYLVREASCESAPDGQMTLVKSSGKHDFAIYGYLSSGVCCISNS